MKVENSYKFRPIVITLERQAEVDILLAALNLSNKTLDDTAKIAGVNFSWDYPDILSEMLRTLSDAIQV